MMLKALVSSAAAATGGVVLASLDIDGYFRGQEFLSILANAISGILIAIFTLLTFGSPETAQ